MMTRNLAARAARIAVLALTAALVALAASGAGLASPAMHAGVFQGQTRGASAADSQLSLPRRPFDHDRHESVSCRECHGSGADHRAILVTTPRDCASCHHVAARGKVCGDCHGPERLPRSGTVTASMSLSVWDTARARMLPFRHELHASALQCADCHTTPVTLARERECASCHADHHRAEADCSSCHTSPPEGVHKLSVHLSCAGSGCHEPARAPAPSLSRTLCLTCHTAQSDHEPGGTCAACHRIPGLAPPDATVDAPLEGEAAGILPHEQAGAKAALPAVGKASGR